MDKLFGLLKGVFKGARAFVFVAAVLIMVMGAWVLFGGKTDRSDSDDRIMRKNEWISDPYSPTDHEKLTAELAQICKEYPQALSLSTIGKSSQGRELYCVKLGHGSRKVLFVGAIHGTEYISCAFLVHMMEIYAKAYELNALYGGYNVKDLLDKTTVYIVPMINPDGVQKVQYEGLLWRANANGVNLNQNFPTDKWEEIDTGVYEPDRADYKGKSAASENETQTIIKLCEQNDFEFMLSFHTKGEVLYWLDDNTGAVPGASELVGKIVNCAGYRAMESTGSVNSYGGGLENWFRYAYNRPGVCVELTPSNGKKQPHNDENFDKLVWNKAKYLGLAVISD